MIDIDNSDHHTIIRVVYRKTMYHSSGITPLELSDFGAVKFIQLMSGQEPKRAMKGVTELMVIR